MDYLKWSINRYKFNSRESIDQISHYIITVFWGKEGKTAMCDKCVNIVWLMKCQTFSLHQTAAHEKHWSGRAESRLFGPREEGLHWCWQLSWIRRSSSTPSTTCVREFYNPGTPFTTKMNYRAADSEFITTLNFKIHLALSHEYVVRNCQFLLQAVVVNLFLFMSKFIFI